MTRAQAREPDPLRQGAGSAMNNLFYGTLRKGVLAPRGGTALRLLAELCGESPNALAKLALRSEG
jgi:hypothetical protein